MYIPDNDSPRKLSNGEIGGPALRFQKMWKEAILRYEEVTGHDLLSSPHLPPCSEELLYATSAKDVKGVVGIYAKAFTDFRAPGGKIRAFLSPLVRLIGLFADTGAEAASSAGVPGGKSIFVAFGVLLGAVWKVSQKYDILEQLLSQIISPLERVELYARSSVSLSPILKNIIVRTLTQILHVLALFTKYFRRDFESQSLRRLLSHLTMRLGARAKDYVQAFRKNKDVDDALKQLEDLTREEELAAAAKTLVTVHEIAQGSTFFQRLELNKHIRDWLNPPDSTVDQEKLRSLRQEGTCRWFLNEDFEDWKSTKNGVYWIYGKPGSGKSILCSSVVDALLSDAGLNVLYFYFDFRDPRKQTTQGFLISLIVQLAARSESYYQILRHFYAENSSLLSPTVDILLSCLGSMLRNSLGTFIVLDGLEECPKSSRSSELIPALHRLRSSELSTGGLQLLVSSRPVQDIEYFMAGILTHSINLLKSSGHARDLHLHISRTLCQPPYCDWPAHIIRLTKNTLSSEANGMFLWTSLQLTMLSTCAPADVEATLRSLPKSLEATYERILSHLASESSTATTIRIRRLFECIAYAGRPLRPSELAGVLAINFDMPNGGSTLDATLCEPNPEATLNRMCASFIQVVEEPIRRAPRRLVQFVHASALDYLLSNTLPESIRTFHLTAAAAHVTLAKTCFTTLLSSGLSSSLPFYEYAVDNWYEHIFPSTASETVSMLLDQFLCPTSVHFKQWQKARPYCQNGIHSLLYWTAYMGLVDRTRALLETDGIDINALAGPGGTALHIASLREHYDVVQLLLSAGARLNAEDRWGLTPMHFAASNGRLNLMKVLVGGDAIVDAHASTEQPSRLGTRDDQTSPVVDKSATVSVRKNSGRALLSSHLPSRVGRNVTTTSTSQRNAEIDARDAKGRTPLQHAAGCGHTETVKLLLACGADVNAEAQHGWTSLHFAASNDHIDVIQTLIDAHAIVDARDEDDTTPLHVAARYDRVRSVRLLVENGATVDARERQSKEVIAGLEEEEATPLHLAAQCGNAEVVEALLELNADPSLRTGTGRTALIYAAQNGHRIIVRLLLSRGADIDAVDEDGRSALDFAETEDYADIVQLLREFSRSSSF